MVRQVTVKNDRVEDSIDRLLLSLALEPHQPNA